MSPFLRSFLSCALGLATLAAAWPASAQDGRIFRCGNEYTNNAAVAKQRDCKLMEGGNITIVQGTRPSGGSGGSGGSGATGGGSGGNVVTAPPMPSRVATDQQRARDADARAILQNELARAQARRAELEKEYNNGEPERLGQEARNYQKYLDRVAELKANIARNQADMEGIQRELARQPSQ